MSDDQKEKHLTPCPEIDTCKMCERFCNKVLEKLDQKSESPFKIGDRVRWFEQTQPDKKKTFYYIGTIQDIPNTEIAWIHKDGDSPGNAYGIKLNILELLMEQKPAGSVKKDDNKYDPTMLTMEMVELVSRVRQFGAKKYARGNFKITGFKYTRSLAAALRHIFAFLNGEDNDPESGLSHLGHAICSLEHCIYDTKNHPENDDRKE